MWHDKAPQKQPSTIETREVLECNDSKVPSFPTSRTIQVSDRETAIESSMLFSDWESIDFPPCKVRYFNPSVDFVAILASYEPDASSFSTNKQQIIDISTEDEARRLMIEMDITIKEVMESELYNRMANQLKNDPTIQSNIKRILGSSYQHVQTVIYCLGSLEHNYSSQYQLAIAVLLKRDFNWIGEAEVFDPMMSPADCKVIEQLGFNVLSFNEECRRRVTKPTLFFMPYADRSLIWNLLDVNWCPSQINQMILLTNYFMHGPKENPMGKVIDDDGKVYYASYMLYEEVIKKYATAVDIYQPREDRWPVLRGFAWNFFNVDSHLDMYTLFPDDFTEEMRVEERRTNWKCRQKLDHIHLRNCGEKFIMDTCKRDEPDDSLWILFWIDRGPRRLKCLWRPPHTGWIKLNFSGKGHDKNTNAGFGGIFRNEFGDHLAIYNGCLSEADSIVANAESLRQGLRCLQYMSPIKKLFVEGNNLSIIRWVNQGPEPPKRIREVLGEIFERLNGIELVAVYHVYEEANLAATELANRGAKSLNLRIWISPS